MGGRAERKRICRVQGEGEEEEEILGRFRRGKEWNRGKEVSRNTETNPRFPERSGSFRSKRSRRQQEEHLSSGAAPPAAHTATATMSTGRRRGAREEEGSHVLDQH
jgi:hypothetical protein